MSEKLKQGSGEQNQKTKWDELAEFQKYVDAVNKKRAEKAAKEKQNRPLALEDKQMGSKPLALEDKQAGKMLALEDKQANTSPVLAIEDKQMKNKVLAIEDKQMGNKPLAIEDKQMGNKPLAIEDKQMGNKPLAIEDKQKSKNVLALEDKQTSAEYQRNLEAEKNRASEEIYQNELLLEEMRDREQLKAENELYDVVQDAMSLQAAPLTAINIDWTHDEKELAHDLAEQALNAEIADAKGVKGVVKRIWKGTLFKKFFETKYTKEFTEGKRTTKDGETTMDILKKQMPDAMERFVLGVTEDDKYIHRNIGDKNGEKLEKVDEATNEKIKTAIANYAKRRPEAGEKVSDLNREFENEIGRIMAELNDGTSNNNYLKVAEEAAKRYQELAINAKTEAEHEAAMEQVMAGFQAYNGEVRSNVRTEAHRDNIDKIVNAIESSKIGQFIPAEIIAGAAGIAAGLTQTGVRAIVGAGGGIIASSAISGLKERNRITEDRARMMRDIANGMDYGNNDKTAKYEKRIGGTLYDMRKAGDLTKNLKAALESDGENRSEDILRAIAEARVRIDFSDSEQKDLIAYSSADKRGKERLDLDIAVIRAEKSLSDEDKKTLEAMKAEIRKQVVDGYDDESGEHHAGVTEKDKDFKKFRTISAIKKSGKTLALGTVVFFGSQEIMAAIDPAKIGVFEKSGLLEKIGIKTENNVDASETILASGFGRLRGEYETMVGGPKYEIHENVSDPDQIKHFEEAGYTKVEVSPGTPGTEPDVLPVDPSASTAKIDVKYDGWANNGTKLSDGNELRAHIENGKFISMMRGASTMNGESINYDPSTVKAFVTLGNSKFEVVGKIDEATGQMTWGENGIFTTPTGETIKAIGDNGEKLYKYFEIAADRGTTDGVQHIIPLATDVGINDPSVMINQVVEGVKEIPATYNFIRDLPGASATITRDIDFSGIGFAPETARRGLGGATTRVEAAPEPVESAPATAPEVPEVSPRTNGPDNLVYSRVTARTAPTPSEAAPTPANAAPAAPEVPPAAPVNTAPASETTSVPGPTVTLDASGAVKSVRIPEYENITPATANNPEIIQNAPEDLKGVIADYENAISARRDAIGDDLSYYLLSKDYITPEIENKVADAVRNLNPNGKAALKEVLDMRKNLPEKDRNQLKFGNALNIVLTLYPDLLDEYNIGQPQTS